MGTATADPKSTTGNADIDQDTIETLIKVYSLEREQIEAEAKIKVNKLNTVIEVLSNSCQSPSDSVAAVDSDSDMEETNIGNFVNPPSSNSGNSNTNGSKEPQKEVSTNSIINGDFDFPPSKFIKTTILQAILDYFLARKSAPAGKDIFNKFYKASHADWTNEMTQKVRTELQNVLDRGVEQKTWEYINEKYYLVKSSN